MSYCPNLRLLNVCGHFCRLLPDLSAENWTGWWYKAYLFSQESGLSGPVIYLDLDTILCSSVDFLAQEVLSSIHILCTPSTPPPPKVFSKALLQTSDSSTTACTVSIDSVQCDIDTFFACLKASEISNEGHHCLVVSVIASSLSISHRVCRALL